jgi:hypothetical protein
MDTNGKKQILFKVVKQKINGSLQELANRVFLQESKKKHANRGEAAGYKKNSKTLREITKTGQNEGKYVSSNIFGYYDRPLREHKGVLKTQLACRTTSFTIKNKELWESSLPFLQKCSKLYKKYGGSYYKSQSDEYSKIHKELKIPGTVFTTITSNYNWSTSCHKDKGDYSDGLGILTVTGKNFKGGNLCFPQFKLLINLQPGDFLLMDTHQWHCNTPLITNENGYRLSFVMYLRKDMVKCKTKKLINDTVYYII